MTLLFDLVYFVTLLAAAPFLARKSWRTGKYRSDWPARFGRGADVPPHRDARTNVILLHCVSVGELLSIQTLVAKLLAADPFLHLVISTGTDTGTARAAALYPPTATARIHTVRFPLDFSFAVESFLDRVRPDVIALLELETWPNFLAIAQSRRIPVLILNGRISEKSFPRYQRIRLLMAAMLRRINWIGAQTDTIAQRFIAVGAAPQQIEVIPTLKYDNAPRGDAVPGTPALAAAIGLRDSDPLFVAGSTGPGEEVPVLDTYIALRKQHPDLRLAIVPRHPEVVPQVIAAIEARGLQPVLRTQRPDGIASPPLESSQVFVLNTMGELRKCYALAFAAFVGRSLIPLGGSDMIEVAALAKPCCFGPFTANFAEVVERLLAEKAATLVRDGNELTAALGEWLVNPAAAARMGSQARQLVEHQRGSTDRYVQKLLEEAKRKRFYGR